MQIENKIVVPYLRINWRIVNLRNFILEEVDFQIEALDVNTSQQVIKKFTDSQASAESDDIIATLNKACELLIPIQISGHIEKVSAASDYLDFAVSVQHSAKSNIFNISAGGEHFNGQGEFNCGFMNEGSQSFAHVSELNIKFPSDVYTHPQFEINQFSLRSKSIEASFETSTHIVFKVDLESSIKAKLKDKDLAVDLKLQSKVDVRPEKINAQINLSDKTQTLVINQALVNYDLTSSRLEWEIAPYKANLKLNSEISSIYPPYQDLSFQPQGHIQFGTRGWYNPQTDSDTFDGNLMLRGHDISLSSKALNFEGLSFQHEISSFKELSSPPGQFLKIKKLDLAEGISDLTLQYQVKKAEKIVVQEFGLNYGTAFFKLLQPFELDPIRYNIKDLKAQVSRLELETLLSLALQDQVKAQGLLTGEIEFSLFNKRPQIHGFLTVDKPGWIQYRPGPKPDVQLNLSDGPMEILKAYLYDFHYEDLLVDIRSNEFYKMTMNFKSLGRNPEYLRGKPLKLNVSIEQNLLAAIQTLMLTYDLPERLKQHFEKEAP